MSGRKYLEEGCTFFIERLTVVSSEPGTVHSGAKLFKLGRNRKLVEVIVQMSAMT